DRMRRWMARSVSPNQEFRLQMAKLKLEEKHALKKLAYERSQKELELRATQSESSSCGSINAVPDKK
ncbi:hypothetical protein NDU88_005794, partial [Pleurodeles waltl]